jgi:hypothetical protein
MACCMNRSETIRFSESPLFRVITAWVWLVVVLVLMQIHPAFARRIFGGPLSSCFEIVMAGLIPVLFTICGRDGWSEYGLRRQGFFKSLLGSAVIVALNYGYSYLSTGHWMQSGILTTTLSFPARIWYALLGLFAYGPLEVFFFLWLVINTGDIFRVGHRNSFWLGLVMTTAIWGLLHIATTHSLSNALGVSTIFFLFALIYHHTKNSIGPMIGWTLINSQAWFLASILWS